MKKFSKGCSALVLVVILACVMVFQGCGKDDPGEQKVKSVYQSADGVFIVNEGTFMAGNGDLSFYNRKDKKISNNLFFSVNNRPPGDIPQSMTFLNETGYLVVNNSNTVEVFSMKDLKVMKTIQGFEMPRQLLIHGNYAYVSQLGSSSVAKVSLADHSIVQQIDVVKSTDRMVISGNRLFAANWSEYYVPKPNNTVMVVDLTSGTLIDSIHVTKEPNSMVLDANGKLWVLSSGGFLGEEAPALVCIDPSTFQVLKSFVFPAPGHYPTLLTRSADGKALYFADTDIFRMDIGAAALPSVPVITASGKYFYGMGVDPRSGEVYLTDAGDFQHDGMVYRFSAAHQPVDSVTVGINPSGVFFYQE